VVPSIRAFVHALLPAIFADFGRGVASSSLTHDCAAAQIVRTCRAL